MLTLKHRAGGSGGGGSLNVSDGAMTWGRQYLGDEVSSRMAAFDGRATGGGVAVIRPWK